MISIKKKKKKKKKPRGFSSGLRAKITALESILHSSQLITLIVGKQNFAILVFLLVVPSKARLIFVGITCSVVLG